MPKTIPQLTDATTVNAADELIIQQGGVTKRATGAELAKGLNTINGIINVKHFGAVGDGVTDDTAAIQSAITQASLSNCFVLVPEGVYVLSSVVIADVPMQIQGLFKCGYDHSVAGINLTAQPIVISNYMRIYCNGAFDADSATQGTAALRGAIHDWLTHYPGFVTLDLEGWRVFVNEEIIIDADKIFGLSGDFNQRRFMTNGKIQAANSFGTAKNIFKLTSSSGNERIQYFKFDGLAFDMNQQANGVLCENGYYQISFTNCFFRNPLQYSLKFNAPLGESQSDVTVDACSFIGNYDTPPQYGIYYAGHDMVLTDSIIAYHQTNLYIVANNFLSGQGAGICVIDANHFYVSAESPTRRPANIVLEDCTHTNITNNYIDNGPVLYKCTNLTECRDHSLLGNLFLYNLDSTAIPGWGSAFSFVEIETNASPTTIQRMSIIANRFVNFASSETITTPFRVYGNGIAASGHAENTIRLNGFFFTTFMATEIPATATFTAATSVAVTPPTSLSPFGLPILAIKTIIPYFSSNPSGLWVSGTAPNFTINTGNSVTGNVRLLLSTSDIHY